MEKTIRRQWVEQLHKAAFPVIDALSKRELKKKLPLLPKEARRGVAYLEAFGRTLSGIAPWLAAKPEDEWEKSLQEDYVRRIRDGIDACTDPVSPDYFIWQADEKQNQNQPLVDAAYFVSGLLKAKPLLWDALNEDVQRNVIKALRDVSKIRCNARNNWCMFTAMVETGLYELTGECSTLKIGCALLNMDSFYLGDGTYGDGEHFAWDYYNSYVMQPFLEEVTARTSDLFKEDSLGAAFRQKVLCRMRRYCEIQERLIALDGSYVVTGRSSAYRTAAFHALAYSAWRGLLPETLPPGQVRSALTKVLNRVFSAPGLFDKNGFLKPGVYGCQPKLKDVYINTGSLSLCCAIFLPLGLDADDPFWQAEELPTTWERIWSGQDIPQDKPYTM